MLPKMVENSFLLINMLGHKRIVQIFLSRPSINLGIKNNDNKSAADLADSKEIKKLFEVFLSEKSLLNGRFTQKITIHNTKSDSIKKMFENIMDTSSYKTLTKKKEDSESSEEQVVCIFLF
jgi:hypothetical protein